MDKKQQQIWQAISLIPKGKVASYSQIAQQAGIQGAARYVGSTLKKLPPETQLPWHRVVNAQRKISLPINSIAYQEQKKRLLAEGIIFKQEKIALNQFAWKPSKK